MCGLLEAAPDAMVVVDEGGAIVLVNVQTEKQFGYSRDELIGRKVTDIIPIGFAERLVADKLRSPKEALAQVIGIRIELTALRRDGREFPIEIMLSPLASANGILVTAAIRDISVRTAAEVDLIEKIAELKRSNEELSQVAYIASHDLQEPLRMVSSYTQLLSQRYAGKLDSDADEFIAFAVDGAARMQRLIQDLLAYSRTGTKQMGVTLVSSEMALGLALINLRTAVEDSGARETATRFRPFRQQTQLVQLFQTSSATRSSIAPRTSLKYTYRPSSDAANGNFRSRTTGLGSKLNIMTASSACSSVCTTARSFRAPG